MLETFILSGFAFSAGLIDAAVGGGGLIQIPALFNVLPGSAAPMLLGTNKFAGACGTAFAARSYVGRISIPWSLVVPAAIAAFAMSFIGAAAVAHVPSAIMRPIVLVLLVLMAAYTLAKKNFGTEQGDVVLTTGRRLLAVVVGGAIGFYDGLFGPGTGSFLIFLFIKCFRLDFVRASACSKVVNLATNAAALMYFVPSGNVLYAFALPMAASNVLGAFVGTQVAIRRGAGFVRLLFLVLLLVLIGKLAYDIFHHP
jgi:uncharacterized membrane protein YfcA